MATAARDKIKQKYSSSASTGGGNQSVLPPNQSTVKNMSTVNDTPIPAAKQAVGVSARENLKAKYSSNPATVTPRAEHPTVRTPTEPPKSILKTAQEAYTKYYAEPVRATLDRVTQGRFGAMKSLTDFGVGVLDKVGLENTGVRQFLQDASEGLEGNVNRIEAQRGAAGTLGKLGQGIGSSLDMSVVGGAVSGSLMKLGVSTRAALMYGNAAATLGEAAMEAGNVYDQNLKSGKTKDEAFNRASLAFGLNSALIYTTNRLGLFSENTASTVGGYLKRLAQVAFTEGVGQEAAQQVIQNSTTGQRWSSGVVEAGAYGAAVSILSAGLIDITTSQGSSYEKTAIKNSQALPIDEAIKAGEIDRAMVYKGEGDVLQPNFAQGRINDVAQKLENFQKGLGDDFKSQVNVENATMEGLIETGLRVLTESQKTISTSDYTGFEKPVGNAPQGGALAPGVEKEEKYSSDAILPVPARVREALNTPVTSKTVQTIAEFTPQEQSAFGRSIIDRINEGVGSSISEEDVRAAQLPTRNVSINESQSSDGRPAQFGFGGQLQIFMPNLINDLKALASGSRILAHAGMQGSRVYEVKQGETIDQLAVRYIRDVLVHEKSHQDTVDLADDTQIKKLREAVVQARASKNQNAIITATTNLQNYMRTLEERAIKYENTNRKEIERELFGSPKKKGAEKTTETTDESARKPLSEALPKEKTTKLNDKEMVQKTIQWLSRASTEQRQALLTPEFVTWLEEHRIGVKELHGIKTFFRSGKVTPGRIESYSILDNGWTGTKQYTIPTKDILLNFGSDAYMNLVETTLTGTEKEVAVEAVNHWLEREGSEVLIRTPTKVAQVREDQYQKDKVRFSEALASVKDRHETIHAKRDKLVDYATAFLPFRERGKFIKAINNTITDKDFEKVLVRMQKATDLADRQALMSEISKELKDAKLRFKNKTPNPKFEYEAQKKLNRIRGLQKEFESRAKALRDAGNKKATAYELAQNVIADKISEFQTAHPDDLIPDELLVEIQELKTVGIKDMTASELRDVLQDIQSIKEEGRMKKELERFNRDSDIMQIKDKVLDTVTGSRKNPKADIGLRRTEDKPTAFEKIGDFFTIKHAGFEEMLDAVSKFDTGSKPYQSFLSDHFSRMVRDSTAKQNAGEIESMLEVSELIKKNYGFEDSKKGDNEMYKHLNSLRQQVTIQDVPMADGKLRQIQISKAEAMQMYMWSQDETLRGTFTEGLNWGPATEDRVYSILSDKDKKMAEAMLGFYREYYKGINEVYSKEYGVDLPFNENYSPLARNVETTIPENVLLAQEIKAYATAKNSSLKSRVNSNLEIKPRDAFSTLTFHINQMEHYKAWSDTMYEMRRVFGDKEVRRTIEDYHGRKYVREIDSMLNDFARDGIDRAKVVEWLDTMRTNTTTAILGMNPKVGLKQLTGVMNYWIEIPTAEFFKGVSGFWLAPKEKATFLYENSPVLRERFGNGYERDIKAALRTDYVKRITRKNNTLREAMFVFIRQSDKLTTYQGAWAAYRYAYMDAKRSGKTEAEARDLGIRNAENVTNRVQESSQLDTLSSIQRGGSLYKALTMFQSQPSKYVRIMWNIARNLKYGRGSRKDHLRRLLVLWIIVPFIYNLVAEGLKPEKYRSTPGEFAARLAFGPLTYPLVVGQIFQSLYGWLSGDNFEYTPTPITSLFDDLQKGTNNLTDGDVDEATTYYVDTIGKLTGVPTTIITKPIRDAAKESGADSPATASF